MMPLREQQLRALGYLDWFFSMSEDDRGSGRSFVIATALIRQAAWYPGTRVQFIDHYQTQDTLRHMGNLVRDLTAQDPRLQPFYSFTREAFWLSLPEPIEDWLPPFEERLPDMAPLRTHTFMPPAVETRSSSVVTQAIRDDIHITQMVERITYETPTQQLPEPKTRWEVILEDRDFLEDVPTGVFLRMAKWCIGDLGRFQIEDFSRPRFEVVAAAQTGVSIWYGGEKAPRTIPLKTFKQDCVNWWDVKFSKDALPSWIIQGAQFQIRAAGAACIRQAVSKDPHRLVETYNTVNVQDAELVIRKVQYDYASCVTHEDQLILIPLQTIAEHGYRTQTRWDKLLQSSDLFDTL